MRYIQSLMGKLKIRSKNNIKIVDLLQDLKLSESELFRILKEINVRMEEGQKNLDQQEAASVRRFLNEQRRRAELKSVQIGLPSIIKVQALAKKLELPVGEVLSILLRNGVMATLNDDIDYDTAAIIAADLGYNTKEDVEELEKDFLTPEKLDEILKKEKPEEQTARPPVVTIMGHVDHGKTSLLDAIRSTNVAKGEAGGITQAISSYQADYKGRTITFVDTPGHETFKFMRRRGASLADIAILVVAGDDGVKPQTKEAVSHAQEAGVPIVVAINKIDKESANLEKVKTELSELGLQPEEWGGKTVVVPVSALKKTGIDELLDMVLLTTDIDPPKAVVNRQALGSVIESRLDKNLGSLATVLVHTGTLQVGDYVVAGKTTGRVRRLLDWRNKPVNSAGPSVPVTIIGLNDVPNAGDVVQAVEETSEARTKVASRRAPVKKLTSGEDDGRQVLAVVIIADSHGSLEAITQTIEAMMPPDVKLSIVRADVGTVTDSDVLTAAAGNAIVYAFNTTVSGMSRKLADKEGVEIKNFDVIYHLSEDVRLEIEKRLPVDIVKTDLGKLKVLRVFFSTPKKKIVGGEVTQGKIRAGSKVIIRRPSLATNKARTAMGAKDESLIGEGEVVEMQREKTAIKEAQQGDQIGLTIEGKGKIKEGDMLDIYIEEKIRRQMGIVKPKK